ncbi:MAG: response regulator [Lachnospiraceae bacterium]|nr:response regulator [Lachnospiraceae bacterium]
MNLFAVMTVICMAELFVYIVMNPHKVDTEPITILISGIMACLGQYMITATSVTEVMYIGNSLYYAGSLACAIAMIKGVAYIYDIKLNRLAFTSFEVFASVIMLLVMTSPYNKLFYKSFQPVKFGRYWALDITAGPCHYFVYIFVAVVCGNIVHMLVWGAMKKKQIPKKSTMLLAAIPVICFINVCVQNFVFNFPYYYFPLFFPVFGLFFILIFYLGSIYDMSNNLIRVYEQRLGYGYLSFDTKLRYMGCSAIAYRFIPELANMRLDEKIKDAESPLLIQILEELDGWDESCAREHVYEEDDFYVECTIRRLERGRRTMGYLVELHDDTRDQQQIKEVEKAKALADKANRSKTAYLNTVSHEIRTPMNAIVGMTDLLLQDEHTRKQERYLNTIKNSGEALVMMVNDMLDLSKIEAGKMNIEENVYNIRDMISDVIMLILERIGSKNIEVEPVVDDKIPTLLYGDGVRLRQVLINLMNNAVKYTEKGFIKVLINAGERVEDKLPITFVVMDSGMGIKSDDLAKLGEAFLRVDLDKNHHVEGTGLGLSISKNFIELMGGHLMVNSRYGEGSEFYFTVDQKIVPDDGVNEVKEGDVMFEHGITSVNFKAPKAHILVVDDTEFNHYVLEEMLKPLEVNMDSAYSGEEALKLVNCNRYDLILMDYVMPHMNGVETTCRIRMLSREKSMFEGDYYEKLPIIALTGDVSDSVFKEFDNNGINGFIEKPVSINKIKAILLGWIPAEKIEYSGVM